MVKKQTADGELPLKAELPAGRPDGSGESGLIIDIHCHDLIGPEPEDMHGRMPRLLESADAFGVSRLVILGNVLRYGVRAGPDEIRTINNATIERVSVCPERLIGFCFINPVLDPGFIREEIDRCVCEHGLQGIKLEIDLNARDERMSTVMEKTIEHDIPLLHHAWYVTGGGQEFSSEPHDIAVLARKYPEARIIMAHLSGCGMRGVQDVAACSNVWVDTSGSQPVAGLVEYAVREIGADRILYGSDVPVRDFSVQIGRIFGADIRTSDRERILWKNAGALLRLEGKP